MTKYLILITFLYTAACCPGVAEQKKHNIELTKRNKELKSQLSSLNATVGYDRSLGISTVEFQKKLKDLLVDYDKLKGETFDFDKKYGSPKVYAEKVCKNLAAFNLATKQCLEYAGYKENKWKLSRLELLKCRDEGAASLGVVDL